MLKLLRAEDRVLGGFGDLELHDALGRNLDLFAGGGIASEAGGAVFQFELAEPGQRESVLRILVRQLRQFSRYCTDCFLVRPTFSAIAAAT